MRREGVEWAGPGVTQSQEKTVSYIVRSTTRVKRVAKDLKDALASVGHRKPYLACLDIAANLFGHRDFASLERGLRAAPVEASLDDELAGAAEKAARRDFHVRVLVGHGLDEACARSVVDAVRPTGRATKAPRVERPSVFHPTPGRILDLISVGHGGKGVRRASLGEGGPAALSVEPFTALHHATASTDYRAVRTLVRLAARPLLLGMRPAFEDDARMLDNLDDELARWEAVPGDYAAPFRFGLFEDVMARCAEGRRSIDLQALQVARALCDARAGGEAMEADSPDWREVASHAGALRRMTASASDLTDAERGVVDDVLRLVGRMPPDLDRTRRPIPAGLPRSAAPTGGSEGEPADKGVKFYLVEDDETLTPLSTARYMRLTRRAEAMPGRAGKQYRVIDAYYFRDGRKPTGLSRCIGLFRSFDRDGLMVDDLRDIHERMDRGMPARRWNVTDAHEALVRRHLKLAA